MQVRYVNLNQYGMLYAISIIYYNIWSYEYLYQLTYEGEFRITCKHNVVFVIYMTCLT